MNDKKDDVMLQFSEAREAETAASNVSEVLRVVKGDCRGNGSLAPNGKPLLKDLAALAAPRYVLVFLLTVMAHKH